MNATIDLTHSDDEDEGERYPLGRFAPQAAVDRYYESSEDEDELLFHHQGPPGGARSRPAKRRVLSDDEPETINLVSSDEEDVAQVRRSARRRGAGYVPYWHLAAQTEQAAIQWERLDGDLEVLPSATGGFGLFAKRDLPGTYRIHYFGKFYDNEAAAVRARAGTAYIIAQRRSGPHVDGAAIMQQYAIRANHDRSSNAALVWDADYGEFGQPALQLTHAVSAGGEIFADYGATYGYQAHGFARGRPAQTGEGKRKQEESFLAREPDLKRHQTALKRMLLKYPLDYPRGMPRLDREAQHGNTAVFPFVRTHRAPNFMATRPDIVAELAYQNLGMAPGQDGHFNTLKGKYEKNVSAGSWADGKWTLDQTGT